MKSFSQFLENQEEEYAARRDWYAVRKADFERRIAAPIPPIQSVHTEVLVRLLRVIQRIGAERINPNLVFRDSSYYRDAIKTGGGYTEAELRAELATREHIPNKQQARKIRQNLAWEKRNREGQIG